MPEISPSPPTHSPDHRLSDLRSLTRLAIGGVEISVIELMRRLRLWELEASELLQSDAPAPVSNSAPAASEEQARYALIGLVFELQDQTRRRLGLLARLQHRLFQLLGAALQPILDNPLAAPSRRQIDRLAARGQQEVQHWIERGRSEEQRSRAVAALAFDETIDAFLEYLTQNPEVKDLVQSQSSGLANEVLEEARERAVSADHFLESLARSLLRRIPRSRLPEPPPELRQSAMTRQTGRDKRA
jgi:hypothetical protein